MNALEKYAAKNRLTEKLAEKVELEPARLQRALVGGIIGGGAALPAATISALLTRNPQLLKSIAQGTALGAGGGALLGQGLPIMKRKNKKVGEKP